MSTTYYTNDNPRSINNAIETVPAWVAGTGTVTIVGDGFTGTGTAFTTDDVGKWLYDPASTEFRLITDINPDLQMGHIQQPLTVDIVATASYNLIPRSRYVNISALNRGATSGTINGVTIIAGESWATDTSGRDVRGTGTFRDPIVVDATGTTFDISVT